MKTLLLLLTLSLVAIERQHTVEHGFCSATSDVFAISQGSPWLSDNAEDREGDPPTTASVASVGALSASRSIALPPSPHGLPQPLSAANTIRAPPVILA